MGWIHVDTQFLGFDGNCTQVLSSLSTRATIVEHRAKHVTEPRSVVVELRCSELLIVRRRNYWLHSSWLCINDCLASVVGKTCDLQVSRLEEVGNHRSIPRSLSFFLQSLIVASTTVLYFLNTSIDMMSLTQYVTAILITNQYLVLASYRRATTWMWESWRWPA